jgi:signal transduction histidine kinase
MKRRLALAIVSVAAAAVLLFALPLAIVLEDGYRDDELLRLQRDTSAATPGIDLSRSASDQLELPRFNGEIAIYTAAGTRVAGVGPPVADRPTRSALTHPAPVGSASGERLVVAVPLLSGEQITGAVRAQRSQSKVSSRAHRAYLLLAGLGAAVLGLAALAALGVARHLARPLETLAVAARRVGEGDFAARAPPTGITEIDDVGAALNSSSSRIGQLVGRERAFSADASHQLRTPLAALRLELESHELSSTEPGSDLTIALQQVDRLENTIDTLLAVARDTPTGERRTDLSAAVQELTRRWHGILAAEGRPLHAVVSVKDPIAAISSAVLAEIADVLVGNARVHGAGAVKIHVRRAGDAYALEVSDQGPGFGTNADSAFERGAGAVHGIGLALAQSLAHSQGARLQITHPGPTPAVTLLVARFGDHR